MKRYHSIGELLLDYRKINRISQAEFAGKINVDSRTVQRWERGDTLIKSDKEEEIVNETFLPYQLIRNLNSEIVIPTYYDFRVRKYSSTEIFSKLPFAFWFKNELKSNHENVRKIDFDFDIQYLRKYINIQRDIPENIVQAIKKACEILPELNLIVTDDSGYYSGHCIIFPISEACYERFLNKEMKEDEITVDDIVDYKTNDKIIFYNYDIAADNNFNLYFMVNTILFFFNKLKDKNYMYCGVATRYDSFDLNEQLGLTIIWQEQPTIDKIGQQVYPRFQSGDFKTFLSE